MFETKPSPKIVYNKNKRPQFMEVQNVSSLMIRPTSERLVKKVIARFYLHKN